MGHILWHSLKIAGLFSLFFFWRSLATLTSAFENSDLQAITLSRSLLLPSLLLIFFLATLGVTSLVEGSTAYQNIYPVLFGLTVLNSEPLKLGLLLIGLVVGYAVFVAENQVKQAQHDNLTLRPRTITGSLAILTLVFLLAVSSLLAVRISNFAAGQPDIITQESIAIISRRLTRSSLDREAEPDLEAKLRPVSQSIEAAAKMPFVLPTFLALVIFISLIVISPFIHYGAVFLVWLMVFILSKLELVEIRRRSVEQEYVKFE